MPIMRNTYLFLLPMMLLGLCLQPAQAEPKGFVAAEYGHPQQFVPVEGTRRLNLVCIGRGEPAVIFLYGLGSGTFDWRKVQPAIGMVTRACTYDRAGNGFSDPAGRASDATNAIADLHALLHASGLSKNRIILVGHSLGGLYATLYAETYPREIAGVLLVEPAFEGQTQAIANAVGPKAARLLAASQAQTDRSQNQCIALAKLGRLSQPDEAGSDCLDNPPDADPEVHQEKNRELKTLAYQRALTSENHDANIAAPDGKTTDDVESERTGASLGSIPLVVLTRGDSPVMPALTADEQRREEAAWKAGHDRLAALSSRGTNIVVPHSGHFVQLDRPRVVVEQIKQILEKVRRQ